MSTKRFIIINTIIVATALLLCNLAKAIMA